MTREERHADLLEDGTEYCCYCGSERGKRFSCCGEVHFETYAQMESWAQDDFLGMEEFDDDK